MPTLSDIFNLDPNVERLTLLPRLRGSLPSEKSVMMPDRYMFDVIAPKFLYDFIRAVKAPGRAAKGEALDEEEALNTAMNMFGGGLATSGSVPLGALGMSARTAPAGSIPLREVPRSPLGFYSKVEEATLPLQNKGSGSQFLAQIQKTPGVKPEEIEVLGLDKFLQSKPTVIKQEVQDYLAANRVDVQEVRLGTPQFTRENRLELESLFGIPPRQRNPEQLARIRELLDIADQEIGTQTTKFSQYTLPGGENYREILLTLPPSGSGGKRVRVYTQDGTSAVQVMSDADIQRMAESGRRRFEVLDEVSPKGTFQSSHFDQPNILAHMRVNDRVVDGKKTLFIEEIQSDWHQAGRKRGYAERNPLPVRVFDKNTGTEIGRFKSGKEAENFIAKEDPAMARLEYEEDFGRNIAGVPDAPFKTTWHELTLKRAIQEASEKGYDQIAFTTGKTQAERYDLSKQVDNIEVGFSRNLSSGKQQRMVNVSLPDNQVLKFRVNDDGIIDWSNTAADYKGKALDDLIGKEIAQKVIATNEPKTFAGVDLQIGGEGMKGFYDQILPKSLQNLTKKYGTKVTKSKLDEGSEVWSMDITPQMREQVKAKGQPLFATAPPLGLATQDPLEQFLGYQEAQNDPLMQFLGYK